MSHKSELLEQYNQDAHMMVSAINSQINTSVNLLNLKIRKADSEEKKTYQIAIDKLTKINK